jgi:hypothetical protein
VLSVIYNGADKTCAEVASATKLSAKLAGMVPRFGKFGEFWTSTNFSGEAEPFSQPTARVGLGR